MFFFSKKKSEVPVVKKPFNEKELIPEANKLYEEFTNQMALLAKERDQKIAEILKAIDDRKVQDILRRVETH